MNVSVTDIDRGFADIKKEVRRFKKSYTSIGFFTTGGDPSNDIAARAIVHEFGAKIPVTKKMKGFFLYKFGVALKKSIITIPERSFMKQTFDKNKNKIHDKIIDGYNRVLDGNDTAKQALSRLGEWYRALMQLTIRGENFVANSPLTIKAKGSSKPLSDTGEMANSIEHRETIKG